MGTLSRSWRFFSLCLLLAGCEAGGLSSDWTPIEPPLAAPDFTLSRLEGGEVSLTEYRGQVVLMEFWATWCGPCRMSMPSLEVIYREHQGQPVAVLLVNAGESEKAIRRWAGRHYTAPILLDAQDTVRRSYGVRGIPQMFIIDPEGRIVYAHSGYGGGLEQGLRLIIKELLIPSESVHA